MGLKKGTTNNPAGRPKGTPNKVTSDLKNWIQLLIDNNRKTFESDLKKLDAKDRLIIIERLMSYIVPKQQSISVEAQIQTEYAELQKLLEAAPDELLDKLTERMKTLIETQK